MTLRGRLLFIPLLVGLLTGTGAWAQGPEAEAARAAAKQAASKADTEEALALLKGMLHYLEGLSRFAFVAHTAYDAVQETGQELEFGGRRRLLVRRPDRMRVEVADRDGERATLFFDGERISVDLPVETAYAQVDKRGTLDEAIDYLEQGLDEPVPLLNLVQSEIYEELEGRIRYGLRVGDATLADRLCHHLAFQGEDVDLQIWVQQGERPLPVRIVITYPRAEGSPQFRAQLSQWDLAPDARDGLFDFTPSPEAERIPFAPRPSRGMGQAGGS